jgi:phosphoglycerate dehydrogenase-like enzyme
MSQQRLRRMKPNAVLINIARGAMVDEAALLGALREGAIAGAALDAFGQEPLPPTSEFWSLDNVLLTPHVAGTSHRGFERVLQLFTENYGLVASGQRPRSAVSRNQGY